MAAHNNVVAMKGIVSEVEPPFFGLMLEFYTRGSMKDVYKQIDVPLRTNVKVLYGIALGIAYLHQQAIEHRDLWPANVLLDRDFTAKVIEFLKLGSVEAVREFVVQQKRLLRAYK